MVIKSNQESARGQRGGVARPVAARRSALPPSRARIDADWLVGLACVLVLPLALWLA